VLGFAGLFWALLYLLPALVAPLQGTGDLHVGALEIWRRQWLVHGHPLRTSWLWGGGSLFSGMAPQAPWTPSALASLLVGARVAALAWAWLQLSLAAAFAYGWLRATGMDHRGAALAGLLGTCALGPLAHALQGQLTWPPLAWVFALGWVLAAGRRLAPVLVFAATAAASTLLLSGAPHEAPVLAAPLLVWALITARPTFSVALAFALGLLPAVAVHAPLWADAAEARSLYDHAAVEARALAGMPLTERALRGISALVLPFVAAEGQADGNLLPLVPCLLAVRARLGRDLTLGVALVAVCSPVVPPWPLVFLVAWHLGRHADVVSDRAIRASIVVAALLGGGASAVLTLRALDAAGPKLPARSGISGVAVPDELYLFQEGYASGIYQTLRTGQIVHRPGGSFSLPEVEARSAAFVRSNHAWGVEAWEGLLELEGSLAAGESVALSIRADGLILDHLDTPDSLQIEPTSDGWLQLTAREDLTRVRLRAR